MSTGELATWWVVAFVGMGGSALFSGTETGIYTINRIRLHLMAGIPGSSAALLEHMIRHPNRLLGTLLVGNNISNYSATLAIAALLEAAGVLGWMQVLVNAIILTPLLLIFGEVLPKDYFRSHADQITVRLARPLYVLQRLFIVTGVLPLLDLVNYLLHHALGMKTAVLQVTHPRRAVTQLMREGAGHGTISPYQSDIVDRVLQLRGVHVKDVMVPVADVAAVRVGQPIEAVWSLADRVPYARTPLVNEKGQVLGILDLQHVLLSEPTQYDPVAMASPIVRIDCDAGVLETLAELQKKRSTIGIVFRGNQYIGIVTPKDLIEPIVGELDVW